MKFCSDIADGTLVAKESMTSLTSDEVNVKSFFIMHSHSNRPLCFLVPESSRVLGMAAGAALLFMQASSSICVSSESRDLESPLWRDATKGVTDERHNTHRVRDANHFHYKTLSQVFLSISPCPTLTCQDLTSRNYPS